MMIKILTVIGARPQIIKAAALSRAIKNYFSEKIKEIILHTGQHYDQNMSDIFFTQLGVPKPDYDLNIGSGTHGSQTAKMIEGIEKVLLIEKPHGIVLFGDTNSTLAAALAASKIHVPIIHIEAGMRSFNKSMPEEVNRILCDHVSTLLFTPTDTGYRNLIKEGFSGVLKHHKASADHPQIFHCGDVMYDNSLYFSSVAEEHTTIIKDLGLSTNEFILSTIHRNNNTDEPERLSSIFRSLLSIIEISGRSIVLPLHPRTASLLENNLERSLYKSVIDNPKLKIIEPVGFLEMISLEKNAAMVITDSGGVQKEAYFFSKPCIILRPETEWVEIVNNGCARVTDVDEKKIIEAYQYFATHSLSFSPVFGNGKASEFIIETILKHL